MISRWLRQAAPALGRRVDAMDDAQLERLLAGVRGKVLLWVIFWAMPRRFDAARARGVELVIEWRVEPRGRAAGMTRQLAIAHGRCRMQRPGRTQPEMILTADGPAFLRLVSGAMTGPRLMLVRRLRLAGSLRLALRLPRIFHVPPPPRPSAGEEAVKQQTA